MSMLVVVLTTVAAVLTAAGDDPPVAPQMGQRGGQVAQRARRDQKWDSEPIWFRGMVRDADGRGLPGARVFARMLADGGMRQYEVILSAVADDRGEYSIPRPPAGRILYPESFRFEEPYNLVVAAKGLPPAMANGAVTPGVGPLTLDVVVAGRSGSASIAVLKDGKPAADASVGLELEFDLNPIHRAGATRSSQGGEAMELEDVVHPMARAGPDGVARFEDLLPGLYRVRAVNDWMNGGARQNGWNSRNAYATVHGLTVSEGEEARATLELRSDYRSIAVHVLRPDGRPVTSQLVDGAITFGETATSGGLQLNDRGMIQVSTYERGLRSIFVRFRDAPAVKLPIDEDPYYEAAALLPFSPALATPETVRMIGVLHPPGTPPSRPFEGTPERTVSPFNPPLPKLGPFTISSNPGVDEHDPATTVADEAGRPVFAARALVYGPGRRFPKRMGLSDARGKMVWREIWEGQHPVTVGPPDLQPPTLVIFGLARYGAVVRPYDAERAMSIVLPTAVPAAGVVTVAGRSPRTFDAKLRVVAVCQDRGALNDALSMEVTPTRDGRFSLPGLASGRYLVQADRDGVWLSRPRELVVSAGQEPPTLTLDIPAPGETVTLRLLDAQNQPAASRDVTLDDLRGPLAALWPTRYRTDERGELTLPGLGAGEHALSVSGGPTKAVFTVRPATDPPTLTAPRVIVVSPQGP